MRKAIRLITALAALCAALCVFAAADGLDIEGKIKAHRQQQEAYHSAAECLRRLGYPDECEAISALSAAWWDEEDEIVFLRSLNYAGKYRITGYMASECGKAPSDPWYGITASLTECTPWRTLAANKADYAFGTVLYIPDISDVPMIVEDRGVYRGTIDVCCNSVAEEYAITGYHDVYVVGGAGG